MFDPELHEVDPATGFHVNKETGGIVGVVPAPIPPAIHNEWPKWVKVHDSHIVRKKADTGNAEFDGNAVVVRNPDDKVPESISTPGYADSHVNRVTGEVTVLVNNEDEEKAATGARAEKSDEKPEVVADDATKRAVHADVERIKREQLVVLAKEAAAEQEKLVAEEAKRRVVEQQEIEKRAEEAAAELATKQRERLGSQLGAPVARASVYDSGPVGRPATDQYDEQFNIGASYDQNRTTGGINPRNVPSQANPANPYPTKNPGNAGNQSE